MQNKYNPLISIIIPTFNRGHLINEVLDSILEQSYLNWECIVVDDGSVDKTKDILTSYVSRDNRIKYYNRPLDRQKGASSCRNYGFEKSKGEYIHWFDSDDLYTKNAIKTYINSFNKNIDVVISPLKKVNFEMIELSVVRIYSDNLLQDYITGKVAFYVSGPVWRRTFLLQQLYLFDVSLGNLDDWDFNLRMLYSKPKLFYLKVPMLYYRIHQASLSQELGNLNITELKSDFSARLKHVSLLEEHNNKIELKVLKELIIDRYIYFINKSLVNQNTKVVLFLAVPFVKNSIIFRDFRFFKIIAIASFYTVFKKGYRWIKQSRN